MIQLPESVTVQTKGVFDLLVHSFIITYTELLVFLAIWVNSTALRRKLGTNCPLEMSDV